MDLNLDFLPEERKGMLKVICNNLETLADNGSTSEFLNKLIVLTDICEAWKNNDTVTVLISNGTEQTSNSSNDIGQEDSQLMSYNDNSKNNLKNVKIEFKTESENENELLTPKTEPKYNDITFCCEHCGKLCKTSQRLRNHIEVVHKRESSTSDAIEKQTFQCYICNRHSVSSEGLKRHMWIHTGEKRCMCSKCGKQFSRPELLKRHTKIHTGEEPYICSFCGKKFVFSQHLKKHIRIHTGEKPYVCNVCSRGYANAETLRKHMELHSKA